MSFIRMLRPDEVKFSVSMTEETDPPDEKMIEDAECRKWIRDQLDSGNQWAWCMVVVRAQWNKFQGEATLGCCSYKSQEDFVQNSGYYEDLCMEAMNDLQESLEKIAGRLAPLVTEESVQLWMCEQTHEE